MVSGPVSALRPRSNSPICGCQPDSAARRPTQDMVGVGVNRVGTFYFFLIDFLGSVILYLTLGLPSPTDTITATIIINASIHFLALLLSRYVAIRSAKAAIQRAREKFDRETLSRSDASRTQKS